MKDERSPSGTPEHRRRRPVPGHPGIYKRGSRFQVCYRLPNGDQKWRSLRTLSEARRFKREADAGDARPGGRQPFKTYAIEWIDAYAGRTARGVSDGTRQSYRDALQRFAVPFFGTVRMDAIDPPLVRAYIAHLAAKDLSPAAVRRYFAPVRALLATAYEDGLLRQNPAAGVRVIVTDKRKGVKKPKHLTAEQTRKLLLAMPPEHRDLAFFLAATGVRISEALAARWGDLGNEDGPVLTIPESKSAAGERTISLTPETMRRLLRRRAEAKYAGDHDAIFPNALGRRMDAHNYRRRIFNSAAKLAGVPWATPHLLRHSLASLMAKHGYGPEGIAAHLGHADGGVLALRTYVHADRPAAPTFIDAIAGGA